MRSEINRLVDPTDILIPEGFGIEVVMTHLTTPINLVFSNDGDILFANAGVATGNGQILKISYGGLLLIAEDLEPPVTGLTLHHDDIYVAHHDKITRIQPDGKKTVILSGLPSLGDHGTNRVVFGPDGKMYFGQGTATNSGVVGHDNHWVNKHPFFHDYPGEAITLTGQNFETKNRFTDVPSDIANTGAFSPYGISTENGEWVKGIQKCHGSILRANPDGSDLELVAWGLRNPFRIKFDRHHRLFATNHGMDVRGSRPVANSPDEFHLIQGGMWYGWPDYTGGYPVTLPHFKPKNKPQPIFLLSSHPMQPPRPIANFTPHSAIMGFDFNPHPEFGPIDDVYIAEFGPSGEHSEEEDEPAKVVGHRVSRINMQTGRIIPFAMNKSGFAASTNGSGGFERPIDVAFGPDGALYVVDFGIQTSDGFQKQSGVIWRIYKQE